MKKNIYTTALVSFSLILSLFFMLPVKAGSSTVSGANFTVTATATHSYVACTVTGSASSGARATVYGWAAGGFQPDYIGARTGSPYVNWYISSVSGYSSWVYCYGIGKLSNGQSATTATAYA